MTRVIVIPSDKTQPLRWASHNNGDYKNITELVFGARDGGTFSMSTVGVTPDKRVSMFYDDEGMFRLEAGEHLADIINLRAMQLYAYCDGGHSIEEFAVPLIGDYVVVGDADDEGNSMDAPAWVMDFPFEWHDKYIITEVEVESENEG